jgi:hypothetical protein
MRASSSITSPPIKLPGRQPRLGIAPGISESLSAPNSPAASSRRGNPSHQLLAVTLPTHHLRAGYVRRDASRRQPRGRLLKASANEKLAATPGPNVQIHATSSAFKGTRVREVAKSDRYSSDPHDLTAAWAKRRPWRVFIRAFVAH